MKKRIFVVSGPTASGKTFLGIQLAKKFNGVVLNADSMQIYKGLPILSAQPDEQEKQEAEHRLYNIYEPYQNNNVYDWLELIKKNVDELLNIEKTPIILGGTGMYISRFLNGLKDIPTVPEDLRLESISLYDKLGYEKFKELVYAYDPLYVSHVNENDKQRLMRVYEIKKLTNNPLSSYENQDNITLYDRNEIFHINLMPDRQELYDRCNLRFKLMVDNPKMKSEIMDFSHNYAYVFDKAKKYSVLHTIGFMELYKYYNNEMNYTEMFESSTQQTRNYAKRQFTWFRNQFKSVEYTLNEIPKKDNITNIIDKIAKLYE